MIGTAKDWLDAQYDVSRQVADEDALLRRWSDEAARTRARLPHRLGVPYGPSRPETLDVFPAAQADAPVFVFLHGGYWRGGSAAMHSWIAAGLRPLGITTILPDYALCPVVGIGEIIRQARAALTWVVGHAAAYGADPGRIAIGGHSAGAHLAAMTLQTPWRDLYGIATEPLRGAALLSGIYDLAPLRHSFLQPDLRLDERLVRDCSPLFSIGHSSASLWITWGESEPAEFARQSTVYHEAWQAAGNRSRLGAVPGTNHFSILEGFADSGSALCRWVADSLA
ncbi:MAG: alpha/beta hydrolase [Proteobacteria bacterium]|nr:alpha/beta hydrolase [Pseudomonadota bacterium]